MGQATLEMLVSLMVALSLVFWLFELCMFTYTCSVLNEAAQEGVRYAIVHGIDSTVCSGPDTACTDQTPYSNVQAVVTAAASASLHNTVCHDDYRKLRQQHSSGRKSGRG